MNGRDRRNEPEPPPGLTEKELRRWHPWRKFTRLESDIVITRRGDDKRPEGDGGDGSEGR